jgi:hypothetical protein
MADPLTDEGLYSIWPVPMPSDPDLIVITGAVPIELSDVVPGAGTELILYADVVTISKDIQRPEGLLTVFARTIQTKSPVTLDVSGREGRSYPPGDSAQRGTDDNNDDGGPGGTGGSGANGGVGDPGGSVRLFAGSYSGPALTIVADGGVGGRGQDGGPGGQAGRGVAGNDAPTDIQQPEHAIPGHHYRYDGTPGQQGGQGGAGGAPGWGGNGGSAGTIVVKLADGGSVDRFALRTSGGSVGQTGTSGTGGARGGGGHGGQNTLCELFEGESGGTVWVCSYGHSRFCGDVDAQRFCVDPPGYQPDGPPGGDPDTPAQPAPPAPTRGADQTPTVLTAAPYTTLAPALSASQVFAWFQMVLHATERYYLAEQYDETVARLTWLISMTAAPPQLGPKPTDPWTDADTQELQALHLHCVTLLAQLRAGLDFYGHPKNYIPVISFHEYQTDLNVLVQFASLVESAYAKYFAKDQKQEVRQAQLASMVAQDQSNIKRWQTEIASFGQQVANVQDELAGLAQRIQEQQRELLGPDSAQFQKAVYDGSQVGCGWEEILTAVLSIAGLATGVDDIASIISAAAEAGEIAEEALTLANIIKQIQRVKKDIESIVAGWQAIEKLITSDTPNAAKLVMNAQDLEANEQQFDQQMQPYLNSTNPDIRAAAKIFQTQMHAFMDLVQTSNQKLLDINGLQLRIVKLQDTIARKQKEIARLQNMMVGDYDPTIAPYAAYMGHAYSVIRDELLLETYDEARAFEYWALQPLTLDQLLGSGAPLAVTVAAFAGVQAQVETLKQDVQTSRGTDKPPYEDIEWAVPPAAFQHILTEPSKQKHVVALNLPPALPTTPADKNPFHDKAIVGVTKVQAWVTGAKTSGNQLTLTLIHTGTAQVVDLDGTLWNFTHDPVKVPFQYNMASGSVTVDGTISTSSVDKDDYINYSPFTTWLIVLDPDPAVNTDLDVTGVTGITLKFWGNAFVFNHARRKFAVASAPGRR